MRERAAKLKELWEAYPEEKKAELDAQYQVRLAASLQDKTKISSDSESELDTVRKYEAMMQCFALSPCPDRPGLSVEIKSHTARRVSLGKHVHYDTIKCHVLQGTGMTSDPVSEEGRRDAFRPDFHFFQFQFFCYQAEKKEYDVKMEAFRQTEPYKEYLKSTNLNKWAHDVAGMPTAPAVGGASGMFMGTTFIFF